MTTLNPSVPPLLAQKPQEDLFETDAARSLLDQLLSDSRLYTQSKDYKELLDFVVRLRNFAPFNAMLLQIQKPGLSYAASARDWQVRFRRAPKEGARPLLILWPFGPVVLVYDVLDTDGDALPEDVASFFAQGAIDDGQLKTFAKIIGKKGIEWYWVDAGDQKAGSICVIKRATKDKEATQYRMHMNKNHITAVQFATLAHELGHLFLGHLGADRALNVSQRPAMNHAQREIEAESVAYLVCARNGVISKSETYLANYIKCNTTIDHLDLYQVMRAAGQVEALLGLTAHTKYDKPTALKPVSKKSRVEPISDLFSTAPAAKPAEIKPADTQFANNKIFTQSAVDAARARLKKKLGNINSGIDPELLQDGMTLAGAHIEAGARSFAEASSTTRAVI